jgi:hypothetical protein
VQISGLARGTELRAFEGLPLVDVQTGRIHFQSQLGDRLLENLGIENPCGLAERAQRGRRDPEQLLDLPVLQVARLLDPPQARQDRRVKVEQIEADQVVVVEDAVPCAVAFPLGRLVMEPFQERREAVKVLDALKILLLDRTLTRLFGAIPAA